MVESSKDYCASNEQMDEIIIINNDIKIRLRFKIKIKCFRQILSTFTRVV